MVIADWVLWLAASGGGAIAGAVGVTRADRTFWRKYRYCPTCDRLDGD